MMQNYLESQFHSIIMLAVGFANIWVLMLYSSFAAPATFTNGTLTGEAGLSQTLDVVLYVIFFWYLVELLLRIVSTGWVRYWFQPNHFFAQMKARYDFAVTALVAVVLLVERSERGSFYFLEWPVLRPAEGDQGLTDAGRITMSLLALRVFSSVQQVQALFFGLLYIVPTFTSIATLCICVMQVYAVGGVILMAGTFIFLEGQDLPGANFNSILDSWNILWQLLVGEGWHDIMYTAVQANDGWMTFFFMSYTLITTLLFTNLVIGIFVSANAKVNEAKSRDTSDAHLTTMDMKALLTESGGGKKFVTLTHPHFPGEPVIVRKVPHGRRRASSKGAASGNNGKGPRDGRRTSSSVELIHIRAAATSGRLEALAKAAADPNFALETISEINRLLDVAERQTGREGSDGNNDDAKISSEQDNDEGGENDDVVGDLATRRLSKSSTVSSSGVDMSSVTDMTESQAYYGSRRRSSGAIAIDRATRQRLAAEAQSGVRAMPDQLEIGI